MIRSGIDSSSESLNKLRDLADEIDFRLASPGGGPTVNFVGGDVNVNVFDAKGVGTRSLILAFEIPDRVGCVGIEVSSGNCMDCKL